MFNSVHSLDAFKVYPSVVCISEEVVLLDEFLWNGAEINADLFRAIQWRSEVEISQVHCHELSIWL